MVQILSQAKTYRRQYSILIDDLALQTISTKRSPLLRYKNHKKIKIYVLIFQKSLYLYNQSQTQDHIMAINSMLKTCQNHLSVYKINLQLPFTIKSSNSRKSQRYERDGHWNQKQRLKYSIFLNFFRQILEDPIKKKRIRIYDMMADMIVTRNSNQCRSHHQKMEKYRITVPQIISSVSEKYEPSGYNEHAKKYQVLIKNLLENSEKYKRTSQNKKTKKKSNRRLVSSSLEGSDKNINESSFSQKEVEVISILQKSKKDQNEGDIDNKKQLKRTTDEYNQNKINQSQDDEDIPKMRLDDYEEDDDEIGEAGLAAFRIQGYNDHSHQGNVPFPPLAQSQGGIRPCPTFYVDPSTRYQYQQQIMGLQLKKQWHVQNVQHLYSQWNNEVQNIKYCDDSINIYNQMLSQHKTQQRQ